MHTRIKAVIGVFILLAILIATVSGGDVINYIEIKDTAHFKENFNEKTTVICFSAVWCQPCKPFKASLAHIAKQEKKIIFLIVDIDKCPDLAHSYQVDVVPQLVVKKRKITGNQKQEYIHNFILESLK